MLKQTVGNYGVAVTKDSNLGWGLQAVTATVIPTAALRSHKLSHIYGTSDQGTNINV